MRCSQITAVRPPDSRDLTIARKKWRDRVESYVDPSLYMRENRPTSSNYITMLKSSPSKATIKTEDNVKIVIDRNSTIVQCDDEKCDLAGQVMNSVIQKELPLSLIHI